MIVLADTPTLGLLIGLPVAGVVVLLCIGAFAFTDDRGQALGAVGGLLATLVIAGVALWPWRYEYHFWQSKEGRVEKVSKRFVSKDEGTEQKFVMVIGGQPYGVTDTRAALVKPGDNVRLACKKKYEWGSADHGWDCRWNGAAQ